MYRPNKSLPVPPNPQPLGSKKDYHYLLLNDKELNQLVMNDLIGSGDLLENRYTGKYELWVPANNTEHLSSIILTINLVQERKRMTNYYHSFLIFMSLLVSIGIVWAFFIR